VLFLPVKSSSVFNCRYSIISKESVSSTLKEMGTSNLACTAYPHRFSYNTKRTVSMCRQITLPHCHIKKAARTHFTGKYGIFLFEKGKKSFGSVLVANCTFGKEYWQSSIFKLIHSRSKSGKVIWRRWNLIVTKHTSHASEWIHQAGREVTYSDLEVSILDVAGKMLGVLLGGLRKLLQRSSGADQRRGNR